MILLTFLFWRELAGLFASLSCSNHCSTSILSRISPAMSCQKVVPQAENMEEVKQISILDLPELALDLILEKLPPDGLCNMASVCRSFRERCTSDRLWERHMKKKWGRLIGHAAYGEWKWFIATRKDYGASNGGKSKGWVASLSCVWPVSWPELKIDGSHTKQRNCLPVHSIMFWYLSLESGKFWFPAQVYNREGNVDFMLSCYDAELSYQCLTDSFHARYPPHRRVMEEGVQWDRLRAPPVDTPAHELHMSDCWNDLRPGDHIEIQWRRKREYPYGWWYGVVGHLESCDRNVRSCCCHNSDTVVLEFNQYTPGLRWRQATINRKDHQDEGNEVDGFYGGIRKLHDMEEITMWKRLWPTVALE